MEIIIENLRLVGEIASVISLTSTTIKALLSTVSGEWHIAIACYTKDRNFLGWNTNVAVSGARYEAFSNLRLSK